MKKIFLLTLLPCVFSYSQITSYGIKFGVNGSTVTGIDVNEIQHTYGAVIGLYTDISINPKVLLQPELNFFQAGYDSQDHELSLDYFELPVLIKTPLLGMEFFAGPSFGKIVSAVYVFHPPRSSPILDKNDFKNTSYDLKIGAAYSFTSGSQNIIVEVRYNMGLSSIAKSINASNRGVTFSIGIGESNYDAMLNATELDDLKRNVLREMKYLTTSEQIREIVNLENKEKLEEFAQTFWKEKDPIPFTPENEFKEEYDSRARYADTVYREGRKLGSDADRGRVYILYGPPDEVYHEYRSNKQMVLNDNTIVHTYDIWIYDKPAGNTLSNNIFSDIYPGVMRFVFADFYSSGYYTQIYSSEPNEKFDPRIFYIR